MKKDDELHELAKKLMQASKKKGAQPPKAAPKTAPKKSAVAKPATKPIPLQKKSKKISTKASEAPKIAKSAPKPKMASANKPEKPSGMKRPNFEMVDEKDVPRRVRRAEKFNENQAKKRMREAFKTGPQISERGKEIAAELADEADTARKAMNRGGRPLRVAEELAAGPAEKAAMKRIGGKSLNQVAGRMGKIAGGGMVGGLVGAALTGLMEIVESDEAGDTNHPFEKNQYLNEGEEDKAASALDRAVNKQAAARKIPRPTRHQPYDEEHAAQGKMEDDFARELKRWPR